MRKTTVFHPSTKGLRLAAGLLSLLCLPSFANDEYYLAPKTFLAQAFVQRVPEPSLLWLTGARGNVAAEILGHRPASLRIRFWESDSRTVWILEEIGREKPITAGFVIDEGRLSDVKVLAFRESRGWEIRHDFFTRQFQGARLEGDKLDKSVDNITGATLSVAAMRRMAKLALYLDREVRSVTP